MKKILTQALCIIYCSIVGHDKYMPGGFIRSGREKPWSRPMCVRCGKRFDRA